MRRLSLFGIFLLAGMTTPTLAAEQPAPAAEQPAPAAEQPAPAAEQKAPSPMAKQQLAPGGDFRQGQPHFEWIEMKKCAGSGDREWSARIVDVPWGEEWEWWCRHTKGGHYGEKRPSGGSWGYPHHCVNVVNVAEYGVWLEPDDYCR